VRPLALLAALEVEASAIGRDFPRPTGESRAVSVREGELEGVPVLLVVGGVGKVAAAMATQYVCDAFRPAGVIGFGLAGAIGGAEPGQVVVASGAVQHDFDARPLTSHRAELPGLGVAVIGSDARLTGALLEGARAAVEEPGRVSTGCVLTGDQIITAAQVRDTLGRDFPGAACVDMETAAVALVARQNAVPWTALRVTSDSADETFDLDDVIGFGAHTAAELFERIMREAVKRI
jgi:adenosylhomocysteine nucleosidase